MKPLLIILKTLTIGCLWSVIFIDGIRVALLVNWHFDIFLKEHWRLLGDKWNSGSSITREEIAFFLIIVSSIPLWLSGWIGLCLIKRNRLFKKIFMWPIYLYKKLRLKTKPPVVIKKKSIASEETKIIKKAPTVKKVPTKRVLPSTTLMQSNINNNMQALSANKSVAAYPSANKRNPEMPTDHALFNFEEDDFDFDFDFDKKDKKQDLDDEIPSALMVDKPKTNENVISEDNIDMDEESSFVPTNNRKSAKYKAQETAPSSKESHTPVLDVIKQKGYDIIAPVVIKNTTIDYVAVSKQQIILCLVDKESGDWLADEEKFNDEEPLWFSESSHRISPVRKIDLVREVLKTKLTLANMNFEIISFVIIQSGNIINAEDMFEIWDEMNIKVARINRGSPKEIRLFSKSLDVCDEKIEQNTFEKLKKIIRSLV